MSASFIKKKLHRAGEASSLILRYAADFSTRSQLLRIYANLGNLESYEEEFDLRLRFGKQVLPCRMRLSDIFILGEILHEKQYALASAVPDDAFIIDAGANIGLSLLWLIGHFPEATIHAFEPAAANFELLTHNAQPYPGVTLFKSAVGSEGGELTLHYGEFHGMHSIMESAPQTSGKTEIVPVVALGEHLEAHGRQQVDLLKMDIEGAELQALHGLRDHLSRVNVIIGEVHEDIVDVDAFYGFLSEAGFRICWKRWFREGKAERVHGFEAARQA